MTNYMLNKRSNPKSTISLLLRNRIKKTKNLISYTFNCSNNTSDNDIPFFHKDAPDGFSYFCTQDEYIQILSHIKTEEYKIQLIQKKQKVEEEIIHTEPEPNKKQFLCQICKSRFDNYLEHIKSKLHINNKSKYVNVFDKIKLTFNRIAEYNKKNINMKDKKITTSINIIDNTIETTKEESYLNNEENKISTKKNGQKNLEKISEKENEDPHEITKDISVKEILSLLDSINDKENINKKNNINICERKNNQKNKHFFNGNYILDLQKITGKIQYYNNLNRKDK